VGLARRQRGTRSGESSSMAPARVVGCPPSRPFGCGSSADRGPGPGELRFGCRRRAWQRERERRRAPFRCRRRLDECGRRAARRSACRSDADGGAATDGDDASIASRGGPSAAESGRDASSKLFIGYYQTGRTPEGERRRHRAATCRHTSTSSISRSWSPIQPRPVP